MKAKKERELPFSPSLVILADTRGNALVLAISTF